MRLFKLCLLGSPE